MLSLVDDADIIDRRWIHHHIPRRLHARNIHRLRHRRALPPRRLPRIQYHRQFLDFPQLGKILLMETPLLLDCINLRAALGVVGLGQDQVRAVVEHLRSPACVSADGHLLISIPPALMHGLDNRIR